MKEMSKPMCRTSINRARRAARQPETLHECALTDDLSQSGGVRRDDVWHMVSNVVDEVDVWFRLKGEFDGLLEQLVDVNPALTIDLQLPTLELRKIK